MMKTNLKTELKVRRYGEKRLKEDLLPVETKILKSMMMWMTANGKMPLRRREKSKKSGSMRKRRDG